MRENTYPNNPQIGNVTIHAITICPATIQFTARNRRAAPTPIIADVFACVVLTGNPRAVQISKQTADAKSAENP